MSLICTNANIPTQEWSNTLIKVDKDIKKYHDHRDQFLIISLPFTINKLKQAMQEFISNTFNDQSLFFCCDLILEFMLWTKLNINNHLKSYNKSSNPKWTIMKSKYDQLLSTESIIIFNIRNCNYLSIPRTINNKQPFKPIYFYYDSCNEKQSELHEFLATQISNYLPHHFRIDHDWGKRTDFTGTTLMGYLCDSGEVVRGDLLRQRDKQIFVHFNTDAPHFGKKYEWITVPNERICPPPKQRPKSKPFEMTNNYNYNYSASNYNYNAYGQTNNNRYRTPVYTTQGLYGADLYGGNGSGLTGLTGTGGGTGHGTYTGIESGYFDYGGVDEELQRAIAASLEEAASNTQNVNLGQETQRVYRVDSSRDDSSDDEEEETDFFQQAVDASRLF